jgi:erythromycin esterase
MEQLWRGAVGLGIVAVALLAGCRHAEPNGAAAPGAISGTVSGPDGQPVAGAMVAAVPTADSSELNRQGRAQVVVASGPDGHFRLAGLPPDAYGLTASAPQGSAFVGGVKVAGDERSVDVRLAPGLQVKGSLHTDDGSPLAGAELRFVRVSNENGDVFYAPLSDGHFDVSLPAGFDYAAKARAEGREDAAMPVLGATHERDGGTYDSAIEFSMFTPFAQQPDAPAEVLTWMRSHALTLRGTDPDGGIDDLDSLADLVRGTKVVSLGEATHGSAEFFQLKQRMFRYLVEKQGFTTLAMEANWPEALAVNEYVLTGHGDPATLLARLRFWTWDTHEVRALIEWMRAYNADPRHTRKVEFQGFDMQYAPEASKLALDYLSRVDPDLVKRLHDPFDPLVSEYRFDHYAVLAPATREAARTAATALEHAFTEHQADYVKHSSEREWKVAQHAAHVVVQAERQASPDAPLDYRDQAMAENMLWLLENGAPGTKLMGWAHNYHATYFDEDPGFINMGATLRHTLGHELVTMAFAFDHGSFQSRDGKDGTGGLAVRSFTVKPMPTNSLDGTLARVGPACFVLPLRDLDKDAAASAWFGRKHLTRDVGSIYIEDSPEGALLPLVAPHRAEALVFVSETHAAQPNPTGQRPASGQLGAGADNLDFEAGAKGWELAPEAPAAGYSVAVREQGCHGGSHCAELARHSGPAPAPGYGDFRQLVQATPYRGKTVRVHAWVRPQLGAGTRAMFWGLADADNGPVSAFVDRELASLPAEKWSEVTLTVEVPAQASRVGFGVSLEGAGSVQLDDVALEPVEAPHPQ